MTVNILAVGDVVGENGLSFLTDNLRSVIRQKNISFTVVNGENAAAKGITPKQADAVFDAGADIITLGNHTFSRQNIAPYLDDCPYVLRPANFAPQVPGIGWGIYDRDFGSVCVIDLIGRCGMQFGPDNPFFEADRILKKSDAVITLVDMHAEATSEKLALGYYLDGRVSAVWGTHTHVQTADARVLPKGTGYITDLGMTGPEESVIGVEPAYSINMFLGNPPIKYEVASSPCKMDCAVFTVDIETGKCLGVQSLQIR